MHVQEKKHAKGQRQRESVKHLREKRVRRQVEESGQDTDVEDKENIPDEMGGTSQNRSGYGNFMGLPTPEEAKACYQKYIEATSKEALSEEVCVVCTCQHWASEGGPRRRV